MGNVINLRLAKKKIKRGKKEKTAEQNRTKFGRTKIEKSISIAQDEILIKKLDGKKLNESDDQV